MINQFVTYDIANKLKELGFDEPCLAFYDIQGVLQLGQKPEFLINSEKANYIFGNDRVVDLAPLWQQALDWLIDKYDLRICFPSMSNCIWTCTIYTSNPLFKDKEFDDGLHYTSLYNAREAAILKAIELISK